MISVKEAGDLVLAHIPEHIPFRLLSIENLLDEVLRQDIVADRDYPPYNRVAMDGIAISFESWANGLRTFTIKSCQRAGDPKSRLKDANGCVEVMTGSVLPDGCDTVIRYEDLNITGGNARVGENHKPERMQNIHVKGSDCRKGDILIKSGTFLNPTHWSVIASTGQSRIRVSARPNVSIISTGDEVVGAGDTPAEHQIRDSNSFALRSSLYGFGFHSVRHFHIRDNLEETSDLFERVFRDFDVVIITGGVSKGKFDYVPEVLGTMGVEKIFHGVRQRPGKPMWFGMTQGEKPVFGLPGNPVSSLVCFYRYVIPALCRMKGATCTETYTRPHAALAEDFRFGKNLTYFLPVSIKYLKDGRTEAVPVKLNGSGDFISLAGSSGFIELPEDRQYFSQGEAYPLYLWREQRI